MFRARAHRALAAPPFPAFTLAGASGMDLRLLYNFAGVSPATTAATLSSIWFQPSS